MRNTAKTDFELWAESLNFRHVFALWWTQDRGYQARVISDGWFTPQVVNVPSGLVTGEDERRYQAL